MTYAERLRAKAASQARRRDRARQAKLCITCCVRPHVDGHTKCQECGEYGDKPRAFRSYTLKGATYYANDGFCIECQAHHRHRVGCVAA